MSASSFCCLSGVQRLLVSVAMPQTSLQRSSRSRAATDKVSQGVRAQEGEPPCIGSDQNTSFVAPVYLAFQKQDNAELKEVRDQLLVGCKTLDTLDALSDGCESDNSVSADDSWNEGSFYAMTEADCPTSFYDMAEAGSFLKRDASFGLLYDKFPDPCDKATLGKSASFKWLYDMTPQSCDKVTLGSSPSFKMLYNKSHEPCDTVTLGKSTSFKMLYDKSLGPCDKVVSDSADALSVEMARLDYHFS